MPTFDLITRRELLAAIRRPFSRGARKDQYGLALLDVLLGVAIFALIAVIALQSMGKFRERAYMLRAVSDAQQLAIGIEGHVTDAGAVPADVTAGPANPDAVITTGDLGVNLSHGDTIRSYAVAPDGAYSICVDHADSQAWALYQSTDGAVTGSGVGASERCTANLKDSDGSEPPAGAFAVDGASWDDITRTVTITGSGFTDASIVNFNRTPVDSVTIVNGSTITFGPLPAFTPNGTYTVEVTAGGEVGSTSVTLGASAPASGVMITSASYAYGSRTLTIHGTGFTSAVGVFGGPATSLARPTSVTDTELRFQFPMRLAAMDGTSGTTTLVHDAARGEAGGSTAVSFTTPDLMVDVTSATFDNATGVMTIRGSNFNATGVQQAIIQSAGNPDDSYTVTIVNPTTATFAIPPARRPAAGASMTVTLAAMDSTYGEIVGDSTTMAMPAGGGETPATPTVTSMVKSGGTVTVTGTNLDRVTAVGAKIGGNPVGQFGFTITSSTSLTFSLAGPPAGMTFDISLIHSSGAIDAGQITT